MSTSHDLNPMILKVPFATVSQFANFTPRWRLGNLLHTTKLSAIVTTCVLILCCYSLSVDPPESLIACVFIDDIVKTMMAASIC